MCWLYFIAYPKCSHFYLDSAGPMCDSARESHPNRDYDSRIPTSLALTGYCYPEESSAFPVRIGAHRECPICLAIKLAKSPVPLGTLPDPHDYETGQTPGASELDNLKRRRDIPINSRKHQISKTYTRKELYPVDAIQFNPSRSAEWDQWYRNEKKDMENYGSVDETWEWRNNMSEVDNIKRRQDLTLTYRRDLILNSYTARELREHNEKERYDLTDDQKAKDMEKWLEIQCKDMQANWVPFLPHMDFENAPKTDSLDSKTKGVLMADPIPKPT